eukprot:Selendium_serpulae@DN5131_c0_g1_i2.p1
MSLRSIFGRIKSNIAEGVNAVITTGALKPLSGAVGLGVVAYNSVFPVPGGTVALIEDRRGKKSKSNRCKDPKPGTCFCYGYHRPPVLVREPEATRVRLLASCFALAVLSISDPHPSDAHQKESQQRLHHT